MHQSQHLGISRPAFLSWQAPKAFLQISKMLMCQYHTCYLKSKQHSHFKILMYTYHILCRLLGIEQRNPASPSQSSLQCANHAGWCTLMFFGVQIHAVHAHYMLCFLFSAIKVCHCFVIQSFTRSKPKRGKERAVYLPSKQGSISLLKPREGLSFLIREAPIEVSS